MGDIRVIFHNAIGRIVTKHKAPISPQPFTIYHKLNENIETSNHPLKCTLRKKPTDEPGIRPALAQLAEAHRLAPSTAPET